MAREDRMSALWGRFPDVPQDSPNLEMLYLPETIFDQSRNGNGGFSNRLRRMATSDLDGGQ